MFATYEDFIAFSTGRMSSGRFGLSHLKEAMMILNNPQFDIPCVHIAGTNGKGSTTNYLRSVLQAAGYRVGTFTSPHLEVHNDRIRINDVNISNAKLLELGNRYHDFIIEHGLTMFEIDMLIASVYFSEEHIDIALYEVGLGGRLDATNIILPELCLITNIGMDHMEFLGNTLEAIAGEKAGIIKQKIPVITGERKEECLKVFREVCLKTDSTLDLTSDPLNITCDHDRVEFMYRGYHVHLKGPALYQAKNASLVIDAALKLRAAGKWHISDEAILTGLSDTLWKGRFEVVHRNPTIVLDGAHNDHGVEAILSSVTSLPKPVIAVFTALKDKNARSMLEKLLSVCDKIIVTEFSYYRGAKAIDLAGDLPVEVIADPREALRKGLRLSENGSLLITGSLYFISDVRAIYLEELIGKEHHD